MRVLVFTHKFFKMNLNSIILASTSPVDKITDAGTKIQETFNLQPDMLIAQIVNFLVVAFVLYRFAFKPLMATIEERQKKISDGLQYAEEMKHKLEETERKYAEILKKGATEAQVMINEARENAKRLMEKQTQESINKAEDILKNARQAAEFEHEKMLADVKKEVVELVVTTTSKVLNKELTPEQRSAYSETAAKELYSNN